MSLGKDMWRRSPGKGSCERGWGGMGKKMADQGCVYHGMGDQGCEYYGMGDQGCIMGWETRDVSIMGWETRDVCIMGWRFGKEELRKNQYKWPFRLLQIRISTVLETSQALSSWAILWLISLWKNEDPWSLSKDSCLILRPLGKSGFYVYTGTLFFVKRHRGKA